MSTSSTESVNMSTTATMATTMKPPEDESDPNHHHDLNAHFSELILLCAIAFLTIVANSLVLMAFYQEPRLRKYSNLYLINLAITDWFVGAFNMPYNIADSFMDHKLSIGYIPCHVINGLRFVFVSVSVCSIILVCIDRHQATFSPINYFNSRKQNVAYRRIFAAWFASCLVWFPFNTAWGIVDRGASLSEGVCFPLFSVHLSTNLIAIVVIFWIPFPIITTICAKIGLKIRRNPPSTPNKSATISHRPKSDNDKESSGLDAINRDKDSGIADIKMSVDSIDIKTNPDAEMASLDHGKSHQPSFSKGKVPEESYGSNLEANNDGHHYQDNTKTDCSSRPASVNSNNHDDVSNCEDTCNVNNGVPSWNTNVNRDDQHDFKSSDNQHDQGSKENITDPENGCLNSDNNQDQHDFKSSDNQHDLGSKENITDPENGCLNSGNNQDNQSGSHTDNDGSSPDNLTLRRDNDGLHQDMECLNRSKDNLNPEKYVGSSLDNFHRNNDGSNRDTNGSKLDNDDSISDNAVSKTANDKSIIDVHGSKLEYDVSDNSGIDCSNLEHDRSKSSTNLDDVLPIGSASPDKRGAKHVSTQIARAASSESAFELDIKDINVINQDNEYGCERSSVPAQSQTPGGLSSKEVTFSTSESLSPAINAAVQYRNIGRTWQMRSKHSRKRQDKATLTLSLVVISYFICWVPFGFLISLDDLYDVIHPSFSKLTEHTIILIHWWGLVQSLLNPLCYSAAQPLIRTTIWKIISRQK